MAIIRAALRVICAAVAARLLRMDTDCDAEVLNVSATLGLATARPSSMAPPWTAYTVAPAGIWGYSRWRWIRGRHEIDGVQSVYGFIYADAPEVISRIPQASTQSFDERVIAASARTFSLPRVSSRYTCALSVI
jgi:hypothetical protein